MEINWKNLQITQDNLKFSLCVGEEYQFAEYEKEMMDNLLSDIAVKSENVKNLARLAASRWDNRYKVPRSPVSK